MNTDFIKLFPSDFADLEKSLAEPSPVSVRLNTDKIRSQDVGSYFDSLKPVAWCEAGYYLPARPVFTLDPLFHAGAYYVQEAASMCVEQCFKTVRNAINIRTALDLCAAPGGKSTHLASLLSTDALLVSNELIRSRTGVLRENMSKWGYPNVVITNNDPQDFGALGNFFDFVLVDAPCSGEGMFRKEPEALKQWSVDRVRHCAARQKRIVREVWDSLRTGGFMMYSTCTYNTLENEDIADMIVSELGGESIPLDLDPNWNISKSEHRGIHAYRFFPHKTASEGFCMSLIRKSGVSVNGNENKSASAARTSEKRTPDREHNLSAWFGTKYNLRFPVVGDTVFACLREFAAETARLKQALRMVSAGIEIAEIKGKDLIPNIDAMLCVDFNPASFICLETDRETALRYLRRDAIVVPADTPRGFVVLTYKNIPFGLMKNLGTRCNNLHPANRRIRIKLKIEN